MMSFEGCTVSDFLKREKEGIIEGFANPFNGILYSKTLMDTIGYPKKEMFIWGDEINYDLRAKKMKFEEYELSVPSKPHDFLRKSFGADYMNFPRHAINNHGQGDSLPMSQRAKANGIDMNEIYQYLLDIYEKLAKEKN